MHSSGSSRTASCKVAARAVLLLAMAALLVAFMGPPAPVKNGETRVTALALPFGARADWQQWDAFLTGVVKRLGEDFRPDQREQLAEFFLDARYQIVDAVHSGASDPVPQLFTDAWSRLAPLVKAAIPGATQQRANQYTSFVQAMDAASAVSGIGQRLGLFRITPDALRGAARLLDASGADPLAYALEVDSGLRDLLGFGGTPAPARPSPLLEDSRLEQLRRRAAVLPFLSARSAHAAEGAVDRLNEWVPERPEIADYLLEVRELLLATSARVLTKSKLGGEHRELYRQIVFATSWQESCWRQFVKKGAKLAPLASTTGDVGLMQVNRVVWRNVYDLKGLNGDIAYNGHAGAEILYHYLTRYGIAKKEDQHPDGHLARATYSAYNAGPRGLARYRGVRQSPTWKKVDDAFWAKFQAVSAGQELAVKSCYGL